jgi:small basic protein
MRKRSFAVVFFVAVTLVMVATVSSTPVVWAQNGNETIPISPGLQPIYEIFKAIGYATPIAVLVGLVTCLIGYLKATPPEEFKLVNFIYTFLISLIAGIATIYGGWTYGEIEQWLGNGALTLYIYWIAKIIAKKLKWGTQATGPPPTV